MVEQVVSVEAELRFVALGNIEGLRQGHVIVERVRTAEGIETGIADLAAGGQSERTGARTNRLARVVLARDVSRRVLNFRKVLTQSRNRCEPERTVCVFGDARLEPLVSY